jgi:hypothetical protein
MTEPSAGLTRPEPAAAAASVGLSVGLSSGGDPR